ncbi:MAG: hypothetical protein CL609_12730 [Anaerolineaceae bacterium]|nr:hypothetical protein [Anaerolineaceae bacterium]
MNDESLPRKSLQPEIKELIEQLTLINTSLQSVRSAALPTATYKRAFHTLETVKKLDKEITALEDENRNLIAVSQIGQIINSSLELDVVLQIVMDTIIRLTNAERGFLMLRNENNELKTKIARNFEQETLDQSEFLISNTIIKRVVEENQAILTTNAQEDPRFNEQNSIIAYNLRSILCVPLHVKNEIIGVIYADNRIRSGLFTQKDLELLTVFANHAAVAIDNAQLFASVKQTLAEVTELKNLMDNIFSSITSGVLTTDIEEKILLCNRSAESILGLDAKTIIGKTIHQAFPPFPSSFQDELRNVIKKNKTIIGLEISPSIPPRGLVDLRLSLAPLKNMENDTQGVAIVLDDLTEKKQLEAQSRLFEKMVSPAVIQQLNPNELELGGRRTELTAMFADIRGFTSFSESLAPEKLVTVLNHYLSEAAEAILEEEGTIDKFMGDAVMAWFNAPIPQFDHSLRAIKAALAIQKSIRRLHDIYEAEFRLSFGIGIHSGEAVLGLVGNEKRLEYTAIGDSINTTKRIQENSKAGQILISTQVYEKVKNDVIVKLNDVIIAKGKKHPIEVFEVLGLKD